jgi:putative molybdopterin biosynthesis protein
MKTRTDLAEIRKQRGMSAASLAEAAGISRQSIYAIEDGSFIPNTAVALRLARILGVTVERLFSLEDSPPEDTAASEVHFIRGRDSAIRPGEMVRLCRVDGKLIAAPAAGSREFLPAVDCVVQSARGNRAIVSADAEQLKLDRRVLIAGCDPALSLLADMLSPSVCEPVFVSASSKLALNWLKQGVVHIAGCHLRDRVTGDYNVPLIRKLFPKGGVRVLTFAHWQEGLLTNPGNAKRIRTVADLGRRGVRFINREQGSGSRQLLDEELAKAGLDAGKVTGYQRIATGHLEAASGVANGTADCCLASLAAARSLGLDMTPLSTERFDLVMRTESLQLPAVKALADALNWSAFRLRLQDVAGYDTRQTGNTQC